MLLGGSRKAMEMIRCPSSSRLPVRRKNGTPAQRQLSIEHFNAMKVSVSDSGSTPSSEAQCAAERALTVGVEEIIQIFLLNTCWRALAVFWRLGA